MWLSGRLRLWLDSLAERREYRRMLIPVVASCWTGGAGSSFAVKDVSPTGAYIVTDDKWYHGTIVNMAFQYDPAYLHVAHIGGNSGATVQMRAKVLRHGPDGVGVQFVYLNNDERLRFQSFLEGAQVKGMK